MSSSYLHHIFFFFLMFGFIYLCIYLLLKYSWFTVFQMYSKVIQNIIYSLHLSGRGKFPPPLLLSSCGWPNKIDTRQINRKKK